MSESARGELVEAELVLNVLPAAKVKRLAELELIIKADLQAFLRVGAALTEIRNSELYIGRHGRTFEAYLKEVWGMGRARGYQLIDAHEVIEHLAVSTTCGHEILPENEAQLRPLTKYKDKPELLADAWQLAVESAEGEKITARLVKNALAAITGVAVARKVREIKQDAEKSILLSVEFTAAYRSLLDVISQEIGAGFATTSKEAMVQSLEAALEVVNEG